MCTVTYQYCFTKSGYITDLTMNTLIKFAYSGLGFGSFQVLQLPQLLETLMLASEVAKSDLKIIISLR